MGRRHRRMLGSINKMNPKSARYINPLETNPREDLSEAEIIKRKKKKQLQKKSRKTNRRK